jgi:hypothetical protein
VVMRRGLMLGATFRVVESIRLVGDEAVHQRRRQAVPGVVGDAAGVVATNSNAGLSIEQVAWRAVIEHCEQTIAAIDQRLARVAIEEAVAQQLAPGIRRRWMDGCMHRWMLAPV